MTNLKNIEKRDVPEKFILVINYSLAKSFYIPDQA